MRFLVFIGIGALYLATRSEAAAGIDQSRNDLRAISVTPEEKRKALAAVTEGAWSFALGLYESTASRTSDSFVVSPLSLSFALAMASYGAREETKRNLLRVLGLDEAATAPETYQLGYKYLMERIEEDEDSLLRVANKACTIREHVQPKDTFLESTRLGVGASQDFVDLSYTKYKRTRLMERWIGAQRNEATGDIVGYSELTFDPMLVLESRVYSPGGWEIPFDDALTEMRNFWYKGIAEIKLPTMRARRILRYGQLPELKAKFVQLPYKGSLENGPSMYIVLPDEKDGIEFLEENLEKLQQSKFSESSLETIDLFLPKFKLENYLWLDEALQEMGLTDIFTSGANFDDISETGYFVGRGVGQAAVMEASSEGTNLGSTFQAIAPPPDHEEPEPEYLGAIDVPPMTFVADHPFVALVRTQGENPVTVSIGRFMGH